jgi:hypothetical protein
VIAARTLAVFWWTGAPWPLGVPGVGWRAGPGDEPIPISDPEEEEGYGDDDDEDDEDEDDDEEPMQLRA